MCNTNADEYTLKQYLGNLKVYFDNHSKVVEGFKSYPKLILDSDYVRADEVRKDNTELWSKLSELEKEQIVDTTIAGFEFVGVKNIKDYLIKDNFGVHENCKDIIVAFRDNFSDVKTLNCSGYLKKLIIETCIENTHSILKHHFRGPIIHKKTEGDGLLTLEDMRIKLQKRFNDLDISKSNVNTKVELIIHARGGDSFNWRIIVKEHELKLKPYNDIHNDLIILANDFRKVYFNVL